MPRLIDLTNKKFGRLTVIKRDITKQGAQPYWVCQCECGNVKSIQGAALRSGHTKSCGCLQKDIASQNTLKDLTNQTFGKLKVLRRDNSKPQGHQYKAYWICQCECGKIISVKSDDLTRGHTRSCGCILTSKGEEKIREILLSNNIKYKEQFTFENLLGTKNGLLRFDFAIFKENKLLALIEYQGQQHYHRVDYFQTQKQYEVQILNDNKKREYCKNNNIQLIEIPYWDYNKININYIKEKIKDDVQFLD